MPKKGLSKCKYYIILLVLFFCNTVNSQNQAAICLNSPLSGTYINNPALSAISPNYLEINFLSFCINADNNYIYLDKDDFRINQIFRNDYKIPTHGENGSYITYDQYTKSNKNGFFDSRIIGPSFIFSSRGLAFGISTSLRSSALIDDVPYHVAKFVYSGTDFSPQQNIDYVAGEYSFSSLLWYETAFNFSYAYCLNNKSCLSAGINLKYLNGLSGLYGINHQSDYTVLNDSTLDVRNFDAEYGYSLPVDYESNEALNPGSYGNGISADIGIVYERKKNTQTKRYIERPCVEPYNEYLYRFGISLTDLGYIHFSKRANNYIINERPAYWEGIDQFRFQAFNQFDEAVKVHFNSKKQSNAILHSEEMTISTPLSLRFFGDYNPGRHFHFRSMLFLPINHGQAYSSFVFYPDYSTGDFTIGLPINASFSDGLRMGLSLKYKSFSVGTEKIGVLAGLSNFSGMDFFMSYGIQFRKGKCRHAASGKKGRLTSCYPFK